MAGTDNDQTAEQQRRARFDEIDAIDYGTDFKASATWVSGRRLIAHWIDSLLLTVIFVVLFVIASLTSSGAAAAIAIGLAFLSQLPYFVLTERRDGRSPGKRMMGIRVVDSHGNTPTTKALVIRTIPLYFEWFFLIALAAILSSPLRRRLGDRLAGTYVIDDGSRSTVK